MAGDKTGTRSSGLIAGMAFGALALMAFSVVAWAEAPGLSIWFDRPAADWEREGLPIGNGAMGAVVMGGVGQDLLQFNEKTLWTGGPGSQGGYDFGIPAKPQVRSLRAVQQTLARNGSMSPAAVAEKLGQPIRGYGDYQNFGAVVLTLGDDGPVEDYRRELDLEQGQVTVSYRRQGVQFTREYFASYPDGVIVVRLSANRPGQIHLRAGLRIPDNRSLEFQQPDFWQSGSSQSGSSQSGFSQSTTARLLVRGALHHNGLAYAAGLDVQAEGGRLSLDAEPPRERHHYQPFVVEAADAVTLRLAAGTDYVQRYPDYRGTDPMPGVVSRLDAAAQHAQADLVARHRADYQALYRALTLDIGQQTSAIPTDQLLADYTGQGVAARTLEATYFQFGRYLLIASSRPGSLPANLQGVWNHSNTPPWNADYHVNINLQMNYWPAYVTNLAETAQPLYAFIDSLVEPGRRSAQQLVGARGWTLFLNTNIWGFTGVIDWPTAFWQPEAAAWLMQHYYDHYRFTGDETFLRERAYPVMKEAARFWLDALVTDPRDNSLVVSPSYSPEHGDFTAGAAMSQQIVHELLSNTLSAANHLGDKRFARQLERTLARLDPGLRIGTWGQLQEWKTDMDDPENHHRHISHLYALHPGNQISVNTQPELANAARRSLNARGDGGTGWAQAWKVNLWARLQDGNRAHKLLHDQLKISTLSNLWDNHPPFQIDGNFGATAGMAEMLVQSHEGVIHLLPALPDAWPQGQVHGLRARGGVTLDMQWYQGQLDQARFHAERSGRITIKYERSTQKFMLTEKGSGQSVALYGKGDLRSFVAEGGKTYRLSIHKN